MEKIKKYLPVIFISIDLKIKLESIVKELSSKNENVLKKVKHLHQNGAFVFEYNCYMMLFSKDETLEEYTSF